MFELKIRITETAVAALKTSLGKAIGSVKSSHRCEAIGRGLGFGSYAALRAAARKPNTGIATIRGDAFSSYLMRHGFDVAPRSLYLAAARIAVTEALEKEHRLTLYGIGVGAPKRTDDGRWESPREHYARRLKSREEFLQNRSLEEFLRALAFVQLITPTKTIRPDTGSYGLKHIAENYTCTYPGGEKLGPDYVSNGALIAAAIHAGFKYKTYLDGLGYDALNVTFNMSKPAIIDLDCEIRPSGARAQERRTRAEWKRHTNFYRSTSHI